MSRLKKLAAAIPFKPFANTQDATDALGSLAKCQITFAHNAVTHQVGMIFNAPASALYLTPEDAEDVARHLLETAKLARGEQVKV